MRKFPNGHWLSDVGPMRWPGVEPTLAVVDLIRPIPFGLINSYTGWMEAVVFRLIKCHSLIDNLEEN